MHTIEALKQCRDAIRDIALDLAVEQQNHLTNTLGNFRPHKHQAAADETAALRAAVAIADATLAAADAASQPPADERKAFEAAYAKRWGRTYLGWCDASKRYKWDSTQEAWTVWRDRASLAQPPAAPAVAGEVAMPEPYAHQAIWHVSNPAEMGWEQWHDKSDPLPSKWDDEPPTDVVSVVTLAQCRAYGDARASQALARVPLSDEQIAFCIFEARMESGTFKRDGTMSYRIARAIERAHGILPAPTEGGAA